MRAPLLGLHLIGPALTGLALIGPALTGLALIGPALTDLALTGLSLIDLGGAASHHHDASRQHCLLMTLLRHGPHSRQMKH
jgi:hypothetical protein